ncbi:MAG TPA: DUF4097 family beta strand repeat-containing protein [Streptomyces sp.]
MPEWSVSEREKFAFDEPVRELNVRIVSGAVNVVGTDDGSARLEVSAVEGPPLIVTHRDGVLTVTYKDLPWKGFLKWLDRKGWHRNAVVTLAVPADSRVAVGVVNASAVVSGIDGQATVQGVSGDTTLVSLSGPIRAETVSGNVEAQALTGDLHFKSVSGDLTVVEAGSSVQAESVSGSMIVDLDPTAGPTAIALTNVSGEIAIRLPHPADTVVDANTTSGKVSNAFEDLRVKGQWGAKHITGRLGSGNGSLRATTVSGSIALLRRPPTAEEPLWEAEPLKQDTPDTSDAHTTPDAPNLQDTPAAPTTTDAPGDPQDAPDPADPSDPSDDAAKGPTDGPIDKKVL